MIESPQLPPQRTRLRRALPVVFVNLLILLAIEGLASTVTVVRVGIERMRGLGERAHTRYDPELGWANIPNLSVQDLYGPGVFFRTNAQGFRNDAAIATAEPPDRVRIVCSGDSFTLGYGVSNDQAWCNHLTALDPRFEPVNMGQGGYGIDQAYLWYRRDGMAFAHDIQVFAFITVDFGRMRDAAFLGYPKPVLAIEEGRLVTRNVPVPQRSEARTKLRELVRTAATFRTVQLVQSWLARPAPRPASGGEAADPLRPVVARVFESLRDLHRQRGSTLVLVYLPMLSDYTENRETDQWRGFVRDEAVRGQIAFVDLVDELRTIPSHEINGYFIKAGESTHGRGEGHYSVRGNEFIARALYRKLVAIEAVAARLERASAASGALPRNGRQQ